MIRAVFLDVDGTLVSTRTHLPSPRTVQALLEARERGILLFVATGRHTRIPEEGYIMDLLPDCFDGYVCLTGHYCFTREGEVVLKHPLDPGDVARTKELSEELEVPYTYAYEDRVLISRVNERVREHNASIELPIPEVGEMDPERDVYAITLYMDREAEMGRLRPLLRHSTTVSWTRGITDVCSLEGGKKAGIQAMMARFGLSPQEVMGVGDSENDLSMFECVGTAVAMGNATPEVKAAAGYVTGDCEEGGIYQAFSHFGLI
ncbi:MAG: Cof-type HAD-IIB family hydrolase [Oscillospiraceae bacterium]|jgi:Cof subfamily protein (haloacid dehalogenase superfamily)|nr:Cof-type HAD-IIB family hydrolase [Oscillospiraceae bacterium]